MHTCFSWVGTGALVKRDMVIDFLKMTSGTNLDHTVFQYGDMYFSTYMNQVPYQLENELIELPQPFAYSAGSKGIDRNKFHMVMLSYTVDFEGIYNPQF
jgi:hypothetical protein